MNNRVRQVLLGLELFCMSPLLLLWLLTSEKNIIESDLERWQQALGWGYKKYPKIALLLALSRCHELRNLYYFRIEKGNLLPRLLLPIIQIFYKRCNTLFIDRSCSIGPGLFIQHGFSTIVMADIGKDCWINQQVTIGHKDRNGRPQLGDNVRITAGAKVIGNVHIGNNVTVGANAVVVKNVPDDCVVVGVPAYIVKRAGKKVKEELV